MSKEKLKRTAVMISSVALYGQRIMIFSLPPTVKKSKGDKFSSQTRYRETPEETISYYMYEYFASFQ